MQLLSDDDQNLAGMTRAELDAAWDLWFELAQHTNSFDPPYTHGVFQTVDIERLRQEAQGPAASTGGSSELSAGTAGTEGPESPQSTTKSL